MPTRCLLNNKLTAMPCGCSSIIAFSGYNQYPCPLNFVSIGETALNLDLPSHASPKTLSFSEPVHI